MVFGDLEAGAAGKLGIPHKTDPQLWEGRAQLRHQPAVGLQFAVLLAFVGVAVWQFLQESANAARRASRRREPWEMV